MSTETCQVKFSENVFIYLRFSVGSIRSYGCNHDPRWRLTYTSKQQQRNCISQWKQQQGYAYTSSAGSGCGSTLRQQQQRPDINYACGGSGGEEGRAALGGGGVRRINVSINENYSLVGNCSLVGKQPVKPQMKLRMYHY